MDVGVAVGVGVTVGVDVCVGGIEVAVGAGVSVGGYRVAVGGTAVAVCDTGTTEGWAAAQPAARSAGISPLMTSAWWLIFIPRLGVV
jgi:hypothetical protein